MKRIKGIIIVVLILFVTGCTADYNITVDDKGNVTEKLVINFDNTEITESNISEHLDNVIDSYDTTNYSIQKNVGKKKSNVTIIRKYKSLEEYKNNSEFFKEPFEDAAVISSANLKGLQTIGEYKKYNIFGNGIELEPIFDEVTINVKLYNNLVESNADNCDKKLNICTWKLNSKIDKFYLKFNYNNSKRYDIIIKEYLYNNWFGIAIVIIIIIGTIITTNIIRKRGNQSNEI